jgi:uncharacterized membrane protein YiaA
MKKHSKLMLISIVVNIVFVFIALIFIIGFFLLKLPQANIGGYYDCNITSEFANDINQYEFREFYYGKHISITYYEDSKPLFPGCSKVW